LTTGLNLGRIFAGDLETESHILFGSVGKIIKDGRGILKGGIYYLEALSSKVTGE